MNRLDIDHLTEAELVDLNHRVVQRLRMIAQLRAHQTMLEFGIGDRVTFELENRDPVFGVLTRYNKRSVTVITDDGHRWTVSPRFLRLAEPRSNSGRSAEGLALNSVLPFQRK